MSTMLNNTFHTRHATQHAHNSTRQMLAGAKNSVSRCRQVSSLLLAGGGRCRQVFRQVLRSGMAQTETFFPADGGERKGKPALRSLGRGGGREWVAKDQTLPKPKVPTSVSRSEKWPSQTSCRIRRWRNQCANERPRRQPCRTQRQGVVCARGPRASDAARGCRATVLAAAPLNAAARGRQCA